MKHVLLGILAAFILSGCASRVIVKDCKHLMKDYQDCEFVQKAD